MSGFRSYADILREARTGGGYDLTAMSRRLHIRPDILMAIENADFDKMPARGYAKNMIRAYARALGLNEREICDMYLDEVHFYEVGQSRRIEKVPPRGSSRRPSSQGRTPQRSSRFSDMEESHSRRTSDGYRRDSSRSLYAEDRPSRRFDAPYGDEGARRRGERQLCDEGYSQDGARRAQRSRQSQRSGRSRGQERSSGILGTAIGGIGSVVSSLSGGRQQGTRVAKSFDTIGSTPPYARNSKPQPGASGSMSVPLLLGLVVIALIVVIAVVVVVNGGKQATEDVPNIPISGLTDTSSPEDSDQGSVSTSAPENAKFSYNVLTGQSAYIEVYINGSETPEFADVVDGPSEKAYEVTGTLTFRTANPDGVKAYLDGTEVQLTRSEGSNYYSYTVDFPQILQRWNQDRGLAGNPATQQPSGASSSSSSSAASTSGQQPSGSHPSSD